MPRESGSRSRWFFAAAGACLVLALLLGLFRSTDATSAVRPATKKSPMPPVRLVNLKKNEAALTDPTPLFLPTEWNAGQDPLESSGRREPGTSFTGYPAKLKFAETDLALTFPSDVVVPARPADALADGKLGQTFLGLDGGGSEPARLPGRRGFVEITETSNGQRVLAQPLTDAEPPAAGWQPMEFLVAVDAMGIVGPPILTESSRNAAVDGYFQNYLVKTLHAGERLAPGFYRICVGP